MFGNIYQGKRVLVTGHTGFKGSWLSLWLSQMGARVSGFSLQPPTNPNHFDLLNLQMESIIGDVRDSEKIQKSFGTCHPEIVFHLAAQPIVRLSYADPIDTYTTNVIGTVNILEACRKVESVRAIIIVTSDKCYENREWFWGYRETDPMGGYDPYSSSKACAELVTSCWRNSFFNLSEYGKTHNILVASGRAGNVIGGGDWATDRLVPDMVSAANENRKVIIRNLSATRPWQHVLEPLSGYLLLGQKLLEGQKDFAEAWNFGPSDNGSATVREIVEHAKSVWPKIEFEPMIDPNQPHEAAMLKLDCSKSRNRMNWLPIWNQTKAVEKTISWYKEFYETGKAGSIDNLQSFVSEATDKQIDWVLA